MDVFYIDEAYPGDYAGDNSCGNRHFYRHSLSTLTKSFLELKDPSQAIRNSVRLAELLLLSNQLDQAHSLMCLLYQHYSAIRPVEDAYPYISRALESFWHAHPSYRRPAASIPKDRKPRTADEDKASLEKGQWHEYRECTRTGWMLEHCSLPEPKDPHIWRETDDAPTIAMCARLLAKDKTPTQYPSLDRLREALAASEKLYAQPQVPITEWRHEWNGNKTVRRHSYLLYRRLVVELAIRLGELDTAARILSLGLTLDGFNTVDGGQLGRYLAVPGIYDVLPILAEKGKEGNPFFIEKRDADIMVREITMAVESRVEKGRQWSLAPERVGWEELLNRLAEAAWRVNRKAYKTLGVKTASQILYAPATEEEIQAAEKKVGELPADFKEMLRIANGFQGGWHFLSGGIGGVECMDIADEDLDIYAYDFGPDELDVANGSGKMIMIEPGTDCDGFRHFIIPPTLWRETVVGREVPEGEYRYFQHASWRGCIDAWDSVREWVANSVEVAERMVERGEVADEDDGDEEDEEVEQKDSDSE